jgi:hypothetical protein
MVPVYGQTVEVEGSARGLICAQRVIIQKKGRLEGTVYARAITVEKGGIFSGSLIIGQELPVELQRPDERTWFSGGGSPEGSPLPATEFGDLPPPALGDGLDDEIGGHNLHVEMQPRRPRNRRKIQ